MDSRERLVARIVLPHLLFAPVVAYLVHRDASRRDHPAPRRVALRYGSLAIPGLLLYWTRKWSNNHVISATFAEE